MKILDVFRYLRSYKKKVMIIIVFAVIISFFSALSPIISQQMIDNGLVNLNLNIVIQSVILLILCAIGSKIVEYMQKKIEISINNALGKKLKMNAFEHGMKLKSTYYKQHGFYKTLGDAQYDIQNILSITQSNVLSLFAVIFKTVGASIGLGLLDWRLSLCIVALIPVKIIINIFVSKNIERLGKECMEQNKNYNSWFENLIAGIIDIKLWNLRKKKMKEYDTIIDGINDSQKKLLMMHEKNSLFFESTEQIVLNSVYIVGAFLIIGDSLTLGKLIAFLSFSTYLLMPVNIIFYLRTTLKQLKPCVASLKAFFALEEENYDSDYYLTEEIDCICFKDVTLEVDGKTLVKNLNFTIHKHEKVLIFGDNGSGKSTILNLLLRLYEPTEGQILFNNISISEFNIEDYRNLFSVVRQDIHLFKGTIHENVFCSLEENQDSRLNDFEYSFCRELINNWEETAKISVGQDGAKLSGGEKQKVALIRALQKKTKILVLDEPTSNYDKHSEQCLEEFIKNNNDYDFYFIVSHHKETLGFVDRILTVEHGELKSINKMNEIGA